MLKPTKIIIEIIPHNEQRYETAGDWYLEGGILHIKASAMSSWDRSMLVALHELIEYFLCAERGISQESVDAFDMAYEKNRPAEDESEPGDHPMAPYRIPHGIATGIERILSSALGIQWKDYESELSSLYQAPIPAEVFPPGKFIQEELDTRGWTTRYLEQISGLSQAQIGLLIEDKQNITSEIAQKLSGAFDTSPEFWLNLEGVYRARQVATKAGPAASSSTR